MRLTAETERQLYDACRTLFGAEVSVSMAFLSYLQPSGIKAAFRRQALLSHPDRFMQEAGTTCNPCAERFIAVKHAYELLLAFMRQRDGGSTPISSSEDPEMRRPAPEQRKRGAPVYYRGSLPERPLFFGQYLFYSGLIPWDALIAAILWQRKQRPRLGEIARKWGWLNDAALAMVVKYRAAAEPLGEAAVRLNVLKESQLAALLTIQRKMQQPFGEFFVVNGYLSSMQLDLMLNEFALHNRRSKNKGRDARRSP